MFTADSKQTKEREHTSSNEFEISWMENRGLFTCVPRTKWRMGVASLEIWTFLLSLMFSAAGEEGIKWWERRNVCKWRKGDLDQGTASMR